MRLVSLDDLEGSLGIFKVSFSSYIEELFKVIYKEVTLLLSLLILVIYTLVLLSLLNLYKNVLLYVLEVEKLGYF